MFELVEERISSFEWIQNVTPLSSIYAPTFATVFYIVMITVLPKVMEKREPVKFTFLLAFHNLFLSILSLAMFSAIVYYLIPFFNKSGIYGIVCDPKSDMQRGSHVFWYYIFYLSKYYEFFDTFFQIVKKRKLIFLHTYHHVITLWLVWVTMTTKFTVQWADIVANAFVHVVMYYYYYLTERGEKVWWKKYITKIQIVQFVFDMTTHFMWYHYNEQSGGKCNGAKWVFWFGNFVITSFLLLFIQFYIGSYRRVGVKAPEKTQ